MFAITLEGAVSHGLKRYVVDPGHVLPIVWQPRDRGVDHALFEPELVADPPAHVFTGGDFPRAVALRRFGDVDDRTRALRVLAEVIEQVMARGEPKRIEYDGNRMKLTERGRICPGGRQVGESNCSWGVLELFCPS
jgi:hypothetical protein